MTYYLTLNMYSCWIDLIWRETLILKSLRIQKSHARFVILKTTVLGNVLAHRTILSLVLSNWCCRFYSVRSATEKGFANREVICVCVVLLFLFLMKMLCTVPLSEWIVAVGIVPRGFLRRSTQRSTSCSLWKIQPFWVPFLHKTGYLWPPPPRRTELR